MHTVIILIDDLDRVIILHVLRLAQQHSLISTNLILDFKELNL